MQRLQDSWDVANQESITSLTHLKNARRVFCKHFLHKIAKKVFVGNCKAVAGRCIPAKMTIANLFVIAQGMETEVPSSHPRVHVP